MLREAAALEPRGQSLARHRTREPLCVRVIVCVCVCVHAVCTMLLIVFATYTVQIVSSTHSLIRVPHL
jgi:hypothetical protein